MVAQAENLALHLGSLLNFVRGLYNRFPKDEIKPGDTFIGNDPYNGGGNHLPDIVLATPVFHKGLLIGWIVNTAHHSDIGGKVPGSTSGDATSIFQEGIRIPIVKICEKGKILQSVMSLLLANTRTPKERLGDLTAQISANKIGSNRLMEVYSKYGDLLFIYMKELQNYAERMLRAEISKLKKGEYEFIDYMDNALPKYNYPLVIKVKITINDDDIIFDFTGTHPQIEAPINVPFNALLACVFYSLKALVGPEIPSNSGIYRVFKVIAPIGSMVNPIDPYPVGVMVDTAQRIPDLIFGALAPILEKRVLACSNVACTTVVFTGLVKEDVGTKTFVYHEAIGGGSGASQFSDGLSGVQVHMTNTSNMPIEALEVEFPMITIKSYGLRIDSGGAGEFRGGLGVCREFEIMSEGVSFTGLGDRQSIPPWGLFGGGNGLGGAFYHIDGSTGEEVLLSNKCTTLPLSKGDIIRVLTPGSGGVGDPKARLKSKILRDVLDKKVSVEKAFSCYGIRILPK